MRRLFKILGIALGLVAVLAIGGLVYMNTAYSHIDSDIRLIGVLGNQMMRVGTEEELIALANDQANDGYELEEGIIAEERTIVTSEGREMPVLILRSEDAAPDAIGLLYIHGGGYVMGSYNGQYDVTYMSDFIREANAVVISPEYTLSKEAPYPAALNDCYDALVWMKDNASDLGINDSQLFVTGGSAGGGLTAATTLYARDIGEVNIAFQMPLYPMINDKMDMPSSSMENTLLWDSTKNYFGWKLYLGDFFETEEVPAYAAALRAEDFSGLPPTYTFVGDQDIFHDETLAYVAALEAAGVVACYDEYPGAYHGFEVAVPDAEISVQAKTKLMEAYRYAADNYFVPQN